MDVSALRRASDVHGARFPYESKAVAFILIADNRIEQATSKTQKRRACEKAATDPGNVILLAAWPGQWSQDVFLIDDPVSVARDLRDRRGTR